jgi:hypothetical protein
VLLGTRHRAAQLVPWHVKAWACAGYNAASYNLEVGDEAWTGAAPELLAEAARAVAYLSKRSGIPPVWTRQPSHELGVCRHLDLGILGGGHTDPTTDTPRWRAFMRMVAAERERGGFRPSWGVGTILHAVPPSA